jgi:hypothetical protein
VFDNANHGSPELKFAAMSLIAAIATEARRPDLDPESRPIVGQFVGELLRGRTDPDPLVAAWASYLGAAATDGGERDRSLAMLRQSDAWPARVLYAVAVGAGDEAAARAALTELAENDASDAVRTYAAAALKSSRRAAQPATAPATMPAVGVTP